MPVIDERGRVFGLVNLIDLTIGVVVLLLIPLAYGAYLLFRAPEPKILGVTPSTLVEADVLSVRVKGQNLRPFMLAGVGRENAEFLVATPTEGEVKLPLRLKPGTYDLSFFDGGRLLVTLPAAITIVPPPPPPAPPVVVFDAQVLGTFLSLTKAQVDLLKVGAKLPAPGATVQAEVLAVTPPQPAELPIRFGSLAPVLLASPTAFQVQALLRVYCTQIGIFCGPGGSPMVLGAPMTLPSAAGPLSFKVMEIRRGNEPIKLPETRTLRVIGTFEDVTDDRAKLLTPGFTFSDRGGPVVARVEQVAQPERAPVPARYTIPAVITLKCRLTTYNCWYGDTSVDAKAVLTLPHPAGGVHFQVQESRDENYPLGLPTTTWLRAVGALVDLDRDTAASLVPGTKFMDVGVEPRAEILARAPAVPYSSRLTVGVDAFVPVQVSQRVQVPAVVRVRCRLSGSGNVCATLDGNVAPDAFFRLNLRGRPVMFVTSAVGADVEPRPGDIHVRFLVRPETRPMVAVGQIDTGKSGLLVGPAHSATLTAFKPDQELRGHTNFNLPGDSSLRNYTDMDERLITFDATVRLPLEPTAEGWMYRGQMIKAGQPFVFQTPSYLMRGWVLDIPPVVSPGAAPAKIPSTPGTH